MQKKHINRSVRKTFRMTPDEAKKLKVRWKGSTCRKEGDYIRRWLFEKPITTFTRNQSLDDLMAELIKLRNELIRVGNNYNQVVYKLHTMKQFSDIRAWLIAHETAGKMLQQRLDSIQFFIDKADSKWLQ